MPDDFDALFHYLQNTTPDNWHQVAWSWNWDSAVAPLQWIIRQFTCDTGTAALVYWYAGPRWFAQFTSRDAVPVYEHGQFDLLMEIERNLLSGYYTRQLITFNPSDDDGINWLQEYQEVPLRRPVPAALLKATPGMRPQRARFIDGYPPELMDDREP